MLYFFDLKQCSSRCVPSIYPRGEFPCCFACQSVASSPDSNEGCHWEAEGINWPYKGREHRRSEEGHHMKRLKHEAKRNMLLSWRILTGDQKNKQHLAPISHKDIRLHLECSYLKKKKKSFRQPLRMGRKKSSLRVSPGGYRRLEKKIPSISMNQHFNPIQSVTCPLVLVCLLCNCRLALFWWSSGQCLEPMYAQLLSESKHRHWLEQHGDLRRR